MKKFLYLSSWSRWSLSLSKGAVIGSIQHVIASTKCVAISLVLLAFLAACSTPTVSSDDSDESSEKVEQEDRSSSSDMSNNKEADRSSSSEKKTESSSSENLLESSDVSADKVVSSSSGVKKTSWSYLNPDIVYSEIIDERDGQAYKIVKIGDQWWMAENLNYRYLGRTTGEDSSSFCYKNESAKCEKYGRLYLWSAAMDSAGIIKGNTANGCGNGSSCLPSGITRGICPEGWHLPTEDEWNALIETVDGSIKESYYNNVSGQKLKTLSDWKADDGVTNEDAFGFSALPAGFGNDLGHFYHDGGYADFWSASENDSCAYYVELGYRSESAYLYCNRKYYRFSVRCLKD